LFTRFRIRTRRIIGGKNGPGAARTSTMTSARPNLDPLENREAAGNALPGLAVGVFGVPVASLFGGQALFGGVATLDAGISSTPDSSSDRESAEQLTGLSGDSSSTDLIALAPRAAGRVTEVQTSDGASPDLWSDPSFDISSSSAPGAGLAWGADMSFDPNGDDSVSPADKHPLPGHLPMSPGDSLGSGAAAGAKGSTAAVNGGSGRMNELGGTRASSAAPSAPPPASGNGPVMVATSDSDPPPSGGGSGQSTVVHSASYTWTAYNGDAVIVTDTVTATDQGTYLWNYHVTNESAFSTLNEGVGMFVVYGAELTQLANQADSPGWTGWAGTLVSNPNTVWWQAGEVDPRIDPGASGDFSFTTPPCVIAPTTGSVFDASFAIGIGGPTVGPELGIKSVTWVKTQPDTAPLDANPNAGGGKRFFPEKVNPGDTDPRDGVEVEVTLTHAKKFENVQVRFYDVDDPSSNDPKLDDETKPTDNRGPNQWEDTTVLTDDDGKARFQIHLPSQPGDNYRAVASLDDFPRDKVYAKQDDGTRAGVYFKANDQAVPDGTARTVKSEMLTAWRHLHVERDHMKEPVAGDGPFFGAGVNPNGDGVGDDDVDPDGPIPDPSIALMVTNYRPAYIEVANDLVHLNTRTWSWFVHNLDDDDAEGQSNASRDVPSQDTFWVVQIVGAYEGPESADFDPNTEDFEAGFSPIGAGCLIYMEVIRDLAANVPGDHADQPTLEKRIVFHESLHKFDLTHTIPPGVGDEGPLDPALNVVGTDAENQITVAQLAVVRGVTNPVD
jgi:hypothetical protein